MVIKFSMSALLSFNDENNKEVVGVCTMIGLNVKRTDDLRQYYNRVLWQVDYNWLITLLTHWIIPASCIAPA